MYPIIILSITGLLTLFLGFSKSNKFLLVSTLLFIIAALISSFCDWSHPGMYFNGMIEINNNIIAIQSILILSALMITGLSDYQFDEPSNHPAEYYAIIQFALVGSLIMVSFNNFIMLFVGLEILSVALYVLTGSDKRNLRGNEAAIKYFLMGAFATGILLFGIAMMYGATSSFELSGSYILLGAMPGAKIFFWLGMVMILIGLLFKVSAAPFHYWTADVYQGAPTLFTAFMATIVKTAGFFALYRIISVSFINEAGLLSNIIYGVIILSLIIGNISAVYQSNFKRMLAFSSISQAGFMLFTILGLGTHSASSLGFYAASYALATVASFGVFMVVSSNQLKDGRPNENIEVFNGLFKKNPTLAVVLLVSLLSLSGIPLTSGFWSKFFIFNDAASKGFIWIMVVAILMSAVSLYYYFKPIRASFADATSSETINVSSLTKWTLIIAAALTILLGVAPQILKSYL